MSDDIAIIGDIHGCIEELRQILDLFVGRVRELIFVGDYVNRGRDSAEVLETLVKLKNSGSQSTFLAGNHDLAFLECIEGKGLDRFIQMGGASTIRSYIKHVGPDVIGQLLRTVPSSHLEFLKSLASCYSSNNLLVTHAPDHALFRSATDDSTQYRVSGHIPQPSLLPHITNWGALIDTGCGTWELGRLTCFLWPSCSWKQSR